ncbi:DNA-binding HxlR family transcriptional regulator [Nonomuraea thailandensis]|uniref:DNA-binding HxlR family transcriptional regulator n=1 Tax=Nonomuraea thailandensis TaxID=1188745 RepID=A0A9X2KCV3_9ACTN|nr:hypothetical protein [Nonomuraea thailandensis]MCP2365441.1 DNA-binding HxlR family transcriptional regulator [Nonomuraea thailandensis]
MIALLERRTVHSVVPPRVECELTALGVSLHEVIRSPVIWTEEHRRGISDARSAYDDRAEEQELLTVTR